MNELLCNSFEDTSLTKFELRNIATKQQYKDYIMSLPNPYFQDNSLFEVSGNTFSLRYDAQSNGWGNLRPERAVYGFKCPKPKKIDLKFHYYNAYDQMMMWCICFHGNTKYCPISVSDGAGNTSANSYCSVYINGVETSGYNFSSTQIGSTFDFSNFSYTWTNDNLIPDDEYMCYVFNFRYMSPNNRVKQCNPVYFEYLIIEF